MNQSSFKRMEELMVPSWPLESITTGNDGSARAQMERNSMMYPFSCFTTAALWTVSTAYGCRFW